MKRFSILTVTLLGFFAFAFSQGDYIMYENTYLTVKTDKFKEFGEAMTKHNEEFHSGGPHHANVWLVSTGQYAGSVVWSMGPCTFTHLDSRPESKEHNEDWTQNVMPNVAKIRETGYWRRADKISFVPQDSLFSKLLITIYDIDDWQSYRFKALMGKVAEVYKEKKDDNMFTVYFPAFDMAGERDAAVVWGFNEYAAFDEEWKFKGLYEEVHGEGSWTEAIDEYRAITSNSVEEVWEIMPEMSGKRPK